MHIVLTLVIIFGSLLLMLYSYLARLSSERSYFLVRGSRDNVQFYEEEIAPNLGVTPEQAAWTFPLLGQVVLVLLGLAVAAWNFGQTLRWTGLLGAGAFLLLDVIVFGQVLPNILLTLTKGNWLRAFTGFVRASVLVAFPLVALGQFLHQIATLGKADTQEAEEPTPSENIETLIQAGEDTGLIEKEDRKLIQSVVEFGAKTVREVMTPRQQIIAVQAQTTLSELKQMLATKRFTRIPVYDPDLDHMIGFVHSGDLFAVEDADLERRTVKELLRPLRFVPDTKRISELLEELKEKGQIAVVVDEYGSVAGLATVEDMVEEIVGEIHDEHEPTDVHQDAEGRYSVPGGMDLDRLREWFDVQLEETETASTVSGLVTEALGRVPMVGEMVERDGLTFQITDANDRRIIRLLVSGPPKTAPETDSEEEAHVAAPPKQEQKSFEGF
jgi:CBS domain containing-hemolysin-like protein